MADMGIFTAGAPSAAHHWSPAVTAAQPRWLVVDANWAPRDIRAWMAAGRAAGAHVAFEPVSAAKSERLFATTGDTGPAPGPLGIFPHHTFDLATPNQLELSAMHAAARAGEHLDDPSWFAVVDAMGLGASGARDAFVRLAGRDAADAGVPAQSVQLLPFVPTVVAKMGSRGALLTQLLRPDDPRLRDPAEARFVLGRGTAGHPCVGGVYMRLFAAPVVGGGDAVSVNGVGDTFLGALVAGLAKGGRVERLVDVAQRAAVMTLGSRESVSKDLGALSGELERATKAHL